MQPDATTPIPSHTPGPQWAQPYPTLVVRPLDENRFNWTNGGPHWGDRPIPLAPTTLAVIFIPPQWEDSQPVPPAPWI